MRRRTTGSSRMAAVVHHGGAGTTDCWHARRHCRHPPLFGDQPFWERRVAALGIGPEPIAQKRLTVERLAAALRRVTEMNTGPCCRRVEDIRAEDGISRDPGNRRHIRPAADSSHDRDITRGRRLKKTNSSTPVIT